MQIQKIEIKNFRLLKDVDLLLEKHSTVIVGRNNSGKTSLAELFRRLLLENSPTFSLEDFSLGVHEDFWTSFTLQQGDAEEIVIREKLPVIDVKLAISYDKDATDLGFLTDFIVDLNPACTEACIRITYQLEPGKIKPFFEVPDFEKANDDTHKKSLFFQALKEAVPKYYKCSLAAFDPNDETNTKSLEWFKLRSLIQGDLISAHRGLDDTTHKDNDALGKILSALFSTASSDSANKEDRKTAQELKAAVNGVQSSIDSSFNTQLNNLWPAFTSFGYPGLPDPKLVTETLLDVELLLKNHTKIRYTGINGVNLPEAYNGLGTRNLIYILLKLLESFKSFKAKPASPSVHIVFIEEPEAHLHPQMQEVFINQISAIASVFATIYSPQEPWPVQFVVTTHSSHVANKASFEAMRYFLATIDPKTKTTCATKIKDLRKGLSSIPQPDKEFLHQYMTLTRCDLLFADKAVLIEGTTERLLLPKIIEKIDANLKAGEKLGSQYLSVMEVGGAYAHIFFKLLDFLELRCLVITDLDTVNKADRGKACKVSKGTGTSNACINEWFVPALSPTDLLQKTPEEKTEGLRRLAYQIPEAVGGPCGRSFEDAFMLANQTFFALDAVDLEESAWDAAKKEKKSAFALRHAIKETGWAVPRYINEGLVWLAETPNAPEIVPDAPTTPSMPLQEDVA